ncbi:MAG: hypothetical protein CMP68_00570 [Flavobacteriales bacterium]|nr:hypothetical protein [Flavobacteriales bacterium]
MNQKKNIYDVYKFRIKNLYNDLSLNFLIPIIIGICISAIIFAKALDYFELLEKNKKYTLSFFFGLILASIPLVFRMIKKFEKKHIFYFIIGAFVAITISTLPGLQEENKNIFFIFFCGFIGIIGMIVPGLSGSYILLILGNYNLLVKECINTFHQDINALIYLSIFFIGMVFGLLTLSKFISWLFKKYRNETLAIICGFILGSLIFIWPIRSAESTALLEIISPIKKELNLNGNLNAYVNDNYKLIFLIIIGYFSLIFLQNLSNRKNV